MIRILGLDLSLNHAGVVELDERGAVTWLQFISDTKVAADRSGGVHLGKSSLVDDREQLQIERLRWWDRYLVDLMKARALVAVGIEGYAFHAAGNTAYQLGEVGGLARLHASRAVGTDGVCLPGPESVKLFAAAKGNATGLEVALAVRDELGDAFARHNPPSKPGAKAKTQTEEDLAAAYTVARLVWTEIELRSGRLRLADLPEHQVRVFNRVTASNPVNVLARERLVNAVARSCGRSTGTDGSAGRQRSPLSGDVLTR